MAEAPEADLQYQTFLRGYGLDKSQAQQQADYTKAQLQARSKLNQGRLLGQQRLTEARLAAEEQRQNPEFERAEREGVRDVKESAAARGSVRGSSRLTAEGEVRANVASRKAAFDAGITDQQAQSAFNTQQGLLENEFETQSGIGGANIGLQSALAGLERQRGEAQLIAQQRAAQEAARQAAYNRALAQLGLTEQDVFNLQAGL